MELRQLEAFAAVMSTGSVTAAGKLLGRSQPAISRLIQDLEAEIGYALFTRSGPRVSPTEQGFLLYEDVEHTLISLRQIRTRAEEIARGEARPLRLAATSALAAGLLPAALADDAELGRHIQIRSASPEQVVHAVLTGAADLGVSSLPLEHRGVTVHWIGEAACVAAVQAGDPAGRRRPCSAGRLRRAPHHHHAQPVSAAAPAGLCPGAGRRHARRADRDQCVVQCPDHRARGPGRGAAGTRHGLRRADRGRDGAPDRCEHPLLLRRDHARGAPAVAGCDRADRRPVPAAQRLLPDCKLHDPARHASMLQVLYGEPLNETEGASA